MLLFAESTDPAFLAIVDDALDLAVDDLRESFDSTAESDADEWSDAWPLASRKFTPDLALATIERIRAANRDETAMWRLRENHWVLLYEALNRFCEMHNAIVGLRRRPREIGAFAIGPIDGADMIDVFFFNTDFLVESQVAEGPGRAGRPQLESGGETFGLPQGMAPDQDAMSFDKVTDEEVPGLAGKLARARERKEPRAARSGAADAPEKPAPRRVIQKYPPRGRESPR